MFTRFLFLALFLTCFVWSGAQEVGYITPVYKYGQEVGYIMPVYKYVQELRVEQRVFSTKYFVDDERVKSKEFFRLLNDNEASSDAYQNYKTQSNLGSSFVLLSLVPTLVGLNNSVQSAIDPEVKDNSLLWYGSAVVLDIVATVFYTNANKHLDDAVRKYNKSKSVSFRWTGNGLKLSF